MRTRFFHIFDIRTVFKEAIIGILPMHLCVKRKYGDMLLSHASKTQKNGSAEAEPLVVWN